MSTISKKIRKKKVDILITEMAEAVYELNREQFLTANSRSEWKVEAKEGSEPSELAVEITIPVVSRKKCIQAIKQSIKKNLSMPITPSMGEPDSTHIFEATAVEDGN